MGKHDCQLCIETVELMTVRRFFGLVAMDGGTFTWRFQALVGLGLIFESHIGYSTTPTRTICRRLAFGVIKKIT